MSRARLLCLCVIGLLLFGYAIGGRGFAYLGVPPLFIGEIALGAAVLLFLVSPQFRPLFQSRIVWLIGALIVWCLIQTLPYLGEFGLDALRDAVLYGYAAFALLIAACLTSPKLVIGVVRTYQHAVVIALPMMLLVIALTGDPGQLDAADEGVGLWLKPGDIGVHLAGAAAFFLLRLHSDRIFGTRAQLVSIFFWSVWVVLAIYVAAHGRGALLAMIAAFGVLFIMGIHRRLLITFAGGIVLVLWVMVALDIRIDQERRDISAAQIIANTTSIIDRGAATRGGIDTADLGNTIEWRLRWWGDIIDYTVTGEYFWTGKGFGINLADSDGYQTDHINNSLRSPHNGHLTYLARAGVPGLLLWTALLVVFGMSLVLNTVRMKSHGADGWARLNLWVLCYAVASIVNGTFDVYLEGPQGGIWFWSIFGFGLAVLALERQALATHQQPVSPHLEFRSAA